MADIIAQDNRPQSGNAAEAAPAAERVPTVIADRVDIVYRVNGTGAGRGSATAALNRILRRMHERHRLPRRLGGGRRHVKGGKAQAIAKKGCVQGVESRS